MDKYVKTDVEGLVKDRNSNAVLSVDNAKLEAYKKKKHYMHQTADQTARLEQVENDISEIKNMFALLLEKLDK